MYEDRKIRFLYPPFILIISLLIGLYFDKCKSLLDIIQQFYKTDNNSYEMILVLIGGGVFILVLGFIIEVITMSVLRWRAKLFLKRRSYTVGDALEQKDYDKLGRFLLPDNEGINKEKGFYASIIFESSLVPKETHNWIARRWNSFNVSSSSCSAIIFSIIPILIMHIKITPWWIIINLIIGFFFFCNALHAWRETKGMVVFLINCDQEKITKYKSEK